MKKLLIIADDFSGALDTGVQFVIRGLKVHVMTVAPVAIDSAALNAQILVVNAESRHLPLEQAYDTVYRIAAKGLEAGFRFFYKKTDSALRGNIGAELSAVMDAAGETRLAFVPAFPKMHRITKDGIQYIDGIPAAESVFGNDPFEPVRESSVDRILHEQTDKSVHLHPAGAGGDLSEDGIHVFDAASEDDLRAAAELVNNDGLSLMAGCAAYAAELAKQFAFCHPVREAPPKPDSLLVICGSKNPVTLLQLDTAEQAGYPRVRLTPEEKALSGMMSQQQLNEISDKLIHFAEEFGLCILDVNSSGGALPSKGLMPSEIENEGTRENIAAMLGVVAQNLLDHHPRSTLLCTGGDTLMAMMESAGIRELDLIGELEPGVVLSRLKYQGRDYPVISKSGGFGEPDLLQKLLAHSQSGIRERNELCAKSLN